jgi:uncharacterized membrane protein
MRLVWATLIIACLLVTAVAQASTPYQINRLGFLSGDGWSAATRINNSGQILGQSHGTDISEGSTGAFLWSNNNGLQNIQVAGKLDRPGGISDSGQITGIGLSLTGASAYVREPNGGLLELPKPGGDIDTCGMDINDAGQVAGWLHDMTDIQNDRYYAVLWGTNGQITTLGGDDELWSAAIDVNNSGQAIWMRVLPGGGQQAYVWDGANGSTPLALLGGTTWNTASSMNDSGTIVGSSGNHAVVWGPRGNVILDLGVGTAYGINKSGQIVGARENRAVLWNPDGSIAADLGMLAGINMPSVAYAINDSGQIVGAAGYNEYQDMEAVLWQPVPEPSSIIALLCGIGGLAGCAIRRKAGNAEAYRQP